MLKCAFNVDDVGAFQACPKCGSQQVVDVFGFISNTPQQSPLTSKPVPVPRDGGAGAGGSGSRRASSVGIGISPFKQHVAMSESWTEHSSPAKQSWSKLADTVTSPGAWSSSGLSPNSGGLAGARGGGAAALSSSPSRAGASSNVAGTMPASQEQQQQEQQRRRQESNNGTLEEPDEEGPNLEELPFDCTAVDHNQKLLLDIEFFEDDETCIASLTGYIGWKRGGGTTEPTQPVPGLLVISNHALHIFTTSATDSALSLLGKYDWGAIAQITVGAGRQCIHFATDGVLYTVWTGNTEMTWSFLQVLADDVKPLGPVRTIALQSTSRGHCGDEVVVVIFVVVPF